MNNESDQYSESEQYDNNKPKNTVTLERMVQENLMKAEVDLADFNQNDSEIEEGTFSRILLISILSTAEAEDENESNNDGIGFQGNMNALVDDGNFLHITYYFIHRSRRYTRKSRIRRR